MYEYNTFVMLNTYPHNRISEAKLNITSSQYCTKSRNMFGKR